MSCLKEHIDMCPLYCRGASSQSTPNLLEEDFARAAPGALEVQHAALSAASPPAPPVPTMRAYQPSVEPLLEASLVKMTEELTYGHWSTGAF